VGRGYLAQRLGLTVAQLFVLSLLVFLGTAALSGDAAVTLLGQDYDPVQAARLRARLHLDDPLWTRFGHWLGGLCTGDLGRSLTSGRPIADLIAHSAVPTLILATTTLLVVIPLAGVLGFTAGTREGSLLDRALTTVTIAVYAIPDFVLALLLVALVSVRLHLVPPTALGADGTTLLTRPALLVLPVIVLSCQATSSLSRQVRAGTIDALGRDYLAHAVRLGLPRWRLLLRHVAPNAVVPAVQNLTRVINSLVGGVLVVEVVFAIPGLATELIGAVSARDVPTVQGITLVLGAVVLLLNLGADLLAHRLVPRSWDRR
jgi:peptide/nickel transport system permease protein